MKYFAYGSNMSKDRIISRGINFSVRNFAILTGYKLIFNKKADAGDFAYANIITSKNEIVEGVLYEFPDYEMSILDKCEGFPKHYTKIEIDVIDEYDESIRAITYIANSNKIVNGLFPTREYLEYLLAGNDLLSASYIKKLCQIKVFETL